MQEFSDLLLCGSIFNESFNLFLMFKQDTAPFMIIHKDATVP